MDVGVSIGTFQSEFVRASWKIWLRNNVHSNEDRLQTSSCKTFNKNSFLDMGYQLHRSVRLQPE